MRNLSLLTAVAVTAAAAAAATSSQASVMTIGSGFASSCYQSAKIQDARQQAIDECDRALSEEALTSEDRVATFVNRGILHLRRVNLVAATSDFDSALRLDPRQPEAWLNKAVLLVRHGKSADALPLVTKALEYRTSKPALAYFVRAVAYEDSGDIAAAYRDLQRAQALEPKWKEPAIELKRFKVRQL